MTSFISVRLKSETRDIIVGKLAFYDSKSLAPSPLAFQYSREWVNVGFALGSDLPLTEAIQYPKDNQCFKFLDDFSSGLWLSRVLNARENFLCGHEDERFSALRFIDNKEFFPYNQAIYSKSLTTGFTRSSESFLRNTVELSLKESKILLDIAADIGGTRPKCLTVSTLEPNKTKVLRVPLSSDKYNVPLSMALMHELALLSQVEVTEANFINGHYIESRFDRIQGKPCMCLSARTLIQNPSPTWLDIADILNRFGSKPRADLEKLFRRLIFDIITLNQRDSHNHIWFYRQHGGWRLAPLYAPIPALISGSYRILPVAMTAANQEANLVLASEISRYFGVKSSKAKEIEMEIQRAVSGWRNIAKKLGASARDLSLLAPSFAS